MTVTPPDPTDRRLRHLATDRHCTVAPQTDDGSGQPENDRIADAVESELGMTNVGRALDEVQLH